MKRAALMFLSTVAVAQPSVDLSHGPLQVSANHRFLQHADGTPFFWLGDTAWELFHRLNREDAELYLENRRMKRFTVIQAVVLAELDGLDTPNAYGERPLTNNDPAKPNEKYFQHVDWIVKRAEEKGLYIGMLPTWGNKVTKGSWEKSAPVIFTAENARTYGQWIGHRYRNARNIVWILGGDRPPENVIPVWRAMAEGIRAADSGKHLMTYHPNGEQSSATYLHGESWLDFNMIQSGHRSHNLANYDFVAKDYARTPVKPALDGESRYEDHPVNWKPADLGYFDEHDVRQAAYWDVFAGSLGHTYGCHPIWQMKTEEREPIGYARNNWKDVLDLPGASSMRHLRALVESRPYLSRVPAQELLRDNPARGLDHAQAMKGDGYAMVYIPAGRAVNVDTGKLGFTRLRVWWFDPKSGGVVPGGTVEAGNTGVFDPPGEPHRGNDWVLVLDDAAKAYPRPGQQSIAAR